MLQARFRPLNGWPRAATPAHQRKADQFRAKYPDTLDLLEIELDRISAKEVTIYADVDPSQIRNDGWLKAGANPKTPGIIVTFQTKAGEISMPCDTYHDWQANVRAIALSLEALRAVDRYGVTRNQEQYRGFRALPAAAAEMSRQSAAQLLSTHTEGSYPVDAILRDADAVKRAFRKAAELHHPDRGGSRDTWETLQRAKAVLTPQSSQGELA